MFVKDDFIGQYQVIKPLASTPSSDVFLVYCASLDTQLVLKFASANFSTPHNVKKHQEIDAPTHFLQQAKLMHQFSGKPHIVNLMHIGVHEYKNANKELKSLQYIVMPYFPQTLAEVLALHQQKLSLSQTLECIEQVLIALKSMHEVDVLHLDIKPQNILLNAANQYYLGDFDNAQILASSPLIKKLNISINDVTQLKELPEEHTGQTQNADSKIKITQKYASPEQQAGASSLDKSADLYSIGKLAFRLICGQTPSSIQSEIAFELNSQKSPAWLTELIVNLLQDEPCERPDSAQSILDIIHTNKLEAEDEATLYANAETLYSNNSIALKEEISRLLLTYGEVNELESKRLIGSYLLDAEHNYSQKREITKLLVEEVKQALMRKNDLNNWFAWVNHLHIQKTQYAIVLKGKDYEQTLQVGRASRADHPQLADAVMRTYFPKTVNYSQLYKRFLLPLLAISLVLLYWFININPSSTFESGASNDAVQSIGESTSDVAAKVNGEPIPNEKAAVWRRSQKPYQNDLHNSEQGQLLSKEAPNALLLDGLPKAELNTKNSNKQVNVNKQQEDFWRYSLQATASNSNKNQPSIQFEMVKINPNFAVMRTEVSQGLYQLCIDDGFCRKRKIFTTQKPLNTVNFSKMPMVNVSWFEVQEEFIPWLTNKTKVNFSLPRLAQWTIYADAENNRQQIPIISHCKNCKNRWAQLARGSSIELTALPATKLGLYGIWGNVQEWLADCVVQNQIERCDQALVIGGSWIDNYPKVQSNNVSALLKRASTPTTGFRLIEVLNE